MFRPIRGMGMMNAISMDVSYEKSWSNQNLMGRRSLTPQELLNMGATSLYKSNGCVNFSDDGKVRKKINLIHISVYYSIFCL